MKRFLLILVAFAFWGVSNANELSFFGGTPFPVGDTNGGLYGEKAGGWEIGVGYTFPVRNVFALRCEASHTQMPNSVTFDGLSPMKVSVASLNAKITTCCKYKVKPYALLGVGLAQVNVLVDSGLEHLTFSSTEFVVKMGGGFDYDAGKRWGLFAESFIFQSDYLSLIPVRAGLRLKL